jgi:hypothetical protein
VVGIGIRATVAWNDDDPKRIMAKKATWGLPLQLFHSTDEWLEVGLEIGRPDASLGVPRHGSLESCELVDIGLPQSPRLVCRLGSRLVDDLPIEG